MPIVKGALGSLIEAVALGEGAAGGVGVVGVGADGLVGVLLLFVLLEDLFDLEEQIIRRLIFQILLLPHLLLPRILQISLSPMERIVLIRSNRLWCI